MSALLRQRLQRDRLQLLLWILGTAALAASAVGGAEQSYGTQRDRTEVLAAVMANPVILLFRGLPSGADREAFTLFLILPFLALMAAFMSTFLAVRHTRMEEESARAELVGATPAGRIAPLVATIVHGTAADTALALVVAVVFLGAGFPPLGALVAGAAAGAVGLSFLAVGLVAGQLLRTSRAANSLAVWVLLLTFLIGGVGNALGTPSDDLQSITSSWLTWLSPFGWAENTRPFADDAPWPLALCLIVAVALGAAAVALQSARDVGESLIPQRAGRVEARALLSSSTGLVWRLTWSSLVGWCIGGLVTGLLATSLASVIDRVGTQIPAVEAVMAALSNNGSLQQGMVVIFFLIVGVLAACAAVQTVCRARQEEARGTAEAVRASPVGRVRWLADYLLVAFAGVVLVVASGVLGAVLGVAGSATDPTFRTDLVRDAAVSGGGQIAAASVYLVVAALVFVLAPRWTIGLGWTLVLAGVVLGLFGALFGLPDWVVSISPIADVPAVSGDTIDVKGLWWLILASVAGAAASLTLMKRRELAA
ncbi:MULTISPECIES: polyketide antibiotic transporter [unclassified Microbacterium]|uniref:ABC transporter permease n=1 Tax=unclassified Microbacterium TaxID=2609290 RepID=UPI00214CCE24|nr:MULTISPECIES: polyketide antibiotic transporter [unclassified Microbacterium]MCR2783361.1 polyketide antibiotic transporter [Microbacterium sp. zg.B96]WIM15767.1 polyketide antibiotic transporter [Microbacterium sp. zg-B96]